MRRTHPRGAAARLLIPLLMQATLTLGACAQTPRASLRVDARDIERRLITVREDIPVEPGPVALNYVRWTPGNHNPSGPIQNVVDLKITDDHGRRLDWRRDIELPTRILVDAPAGASVLTLDFAYLTNQPTVISRSTDSYGFTEFGALNWNTVLFYPGDADKDEWTLEPELRLPGSWRAASSLAVARRGAGRIQYTPVSLAELVDSPVIFGSTLRAYTLDTHSKTPHEFDAVAPEKSLTDLGAERLQKFGVMVDQAEAVFGPFPREQYHFLILLADAVPGLGVEHNKSTLISLGDHTFNDAERKGDPIGVIPHEYIHAWNGKLRTPAGLLARNYHTTADPRLLWVYEGMTTYYGDLLAERAGLMTADEYVTTITNRIADETLRSGRGWQSVEDTAVMLRYLRARSASWTDKRRGVAYYGEGALFWMEADAIIRRGTRGERSLDDFCRSFFDVRPGAPGSPVTYTKQDVIDALAAVYDGQDWGALIRARLETPAESLTYHELIANLGFHLEFAATPTDEQAKRARRATGADLRFSIGLTTDKDGAVTRIVPGSIADEARLGAGMKILAVNDLTFTPARLRDAVAKTPTTEFLSLLVASGGEVRTVRLRYRGGLRYPRLAAIPGQVNILEAIMQPR